MTVLCKLFLIEYVKNALLQKVLHNISFDVDFVGIALVSFLCWFRF